MLIVLNCGSQSIKYKIFTNQLKEITKKTIEVKNQKKYKQELEKEIKKLACFKNKVEKICHRVVHGGEKFKEPIIINKNNLKILKKYNKLAPLHNPFNIAGIEVSSKIFPQAKQTAVFDTGFHSSLPEKAFTYALPENLIKKYHFRKFGFHGISHEYVARAAAKKINKSFNQLKIITCHLGGGASIAAINKGKVVDTSMGFSPLSGLIMMTRCGDIDPGILIQLVQDFSSEKVNEILNKFSGIKAISGYADMKQVLNEAQKNNKKAKLALEVFVYRIQQYIGSYYAILNHCDLLIFTGSIGSGSSKIRKMVCSNLKILKNVKIMAIKTNEELLIAEKSLNL